MPAERPGWLCRDCETEPGRTAPAGPSPSVVSAPPADEIAQFFPTLQILEYIGSGGMGMIYKARQAQLDRVVALKILSPELRRDEAFADRFSREAQALAKLHHSNIVSIFDFGEAGGYYYLLMEYVDGVTLRDVIDEKRLRPQEAERLVVEICDGLQFAHEEGIVHRDIKPSNILIDKKGRVKIADFGLAKLAGKDGRWGRGATTMVLGTPHYMAPEQVDAPSNVDQRADIYALGVVFYEMLTGQLPLGRFDLPSARRGSEPRLDAVVLRALEREPRRRFQTAYEMRTAVESASGMLRRDWHPQLKARWRVLGIFALMAVSAALAIMLYLVLKQHWPETETGRIPAGAMEAFGAGPEGAALGRRMINTLHLSKEQAQTVNTILRHSTRDFGMLERLHTDRFKDSAGHVHVTIQPFPEEMGRLMDHMWSEMALVLSTNQLAEAHKLHFDRFFPHTGAKPVSLEIWQENGEYHYIENKDATDENTTNESGRLPPRFRRLFPGGSQ